MRGYRQRLAVDPTRVFNDLWLRLDLHGADLLAHQLEDHGDVFGPHPHTAHRLLLADAVGINGAVDAVAAVGRRLALSFHANPELGDRVVGVTPGELLAGAGVHPRRVHELAAFLDAEGADGGAALLAEADTERAHVDPLVGLVGGPPPRVQTESG